MNDQFSQDNIPEKKISIVRRSGQLIGAGAHKVVIRPAQMRYMRLYHQRSMSLVADLLIIVGIMMLFTALIFFWNHPITSNRYIDLQIGVNSEQVSGAEVSYKIYWENDNRNAVQDSYLSLMPPKGFIIKKVIASGFEYKESDRFIVMNDLLPGASGEFEIIGQMWTDVQKGADWEIRLYYKNLGIRHNKTTKHNFVYNRSLLVGEIDVPDKIYLGNQFPIHIRINNTSDEKLSSAHIGMQFPADFEYIQKPNIVQDGRWNIGTLEPGESREIILLGRVKYLAATSARFGIVVNLENYDQILRQDWQLGESEFIRPKIDLDFSLRPASEYRVGSEYDTQLYYYNYEDFVLNDVRINFYSSASGLVNVFTPSQYYFKEVGIQDENYLSSKFVITKPGNEINKNMSIWAELSWLDSQSEELIRRYVFSEKKQFLVSPHLNLSARLYYFTPSGDQISYGPLPPIVGESTSYWVSIHLWPSFGEVYDLLLQAELGEGVRLVEYNTSLGTILDSDRIVWMVGDYNSSWQYQPQPRLNLHLEITPQDYQLGKQVILLNRLSASAASSLLSDVMVVELLGVNNDMSDDRYLPNNGQISSW